jgi:hypothetical protein
MKIVEKPATPHEAYRRAFPDAFLGAYYADLITKHVKNVELWYQVLADERADLKELERRRVRVPWLIEQYKKMEASIREIETPADRLTTHRGPTIETPQQSPQSIAAILEEVEAIRLAKVKDSPFWQNKRGTA